MVTPSAGTAYRPYGPPTKFIEVLRRFRTRNLPDIVDASQLRASGASQTTASRLLGALRFMALIDQAGTPLPDLLVLARSGEREYRAKLAEILRAAYRDIFQNADPTVGTQREIIDAFMPYEPASQRYRMAVFFLGLCIEAGIPVMEEPRRRKALGTKTARQAPASSPRAEPVTQTQDGFVEHDLLVALTSPLIRGMFEILPEPGMPWSTARKASWLDAMKLNLDQVYPDFE